MPLPRLIVITDWTLGEALLLERLGAALSVGPRVAVQHRHPDVSGRRFVEEARRVAELCARNGNALFINGRLDVALLLGAHLHLPAHGPLAGEVRPHLPRDRWLSAAVHDEAEARDAEDADFALVSPVFPAGSKPHDPRAPLGTAGFDRLATRLTCPAYALGGLTAERARSLPNAAGFAAMSSILQSADPARTVREWLPSPPS